MFMIETTPLGILLIIAVMTVVTIATRWLGSFLMEHIPLSPRTERFIAAMASSVLIAVVVPMAVAGDWGARAALITTGALVLISGRILPAIAAGLGAAALVRYLY
ncbi:putative membrane protein [Natronospira proteinivora]|uniref:Membrane protein n=1 Tax=Natronospira proteinivora TaxID=1807133 RepID=A0ABT1G9S9_9GAMM|nr:AzlD domain-containing protein [Natronospira proteinivora]MCP1728068.1 putative membrane protein [Natronospira proteinivora]